MKGCIMKSSIARSSLLVVKASHFMWFFPLVLVFLTLHYASAASLRLPSLPPSAFADENITINVGSDGSVIILQ